MFEVNRDVDVWCHAMPCHAMPCHDDLGLTVLSFLMSCNCVTASVQFLNQDLA